MLWELMNKGSVRCTSDEETSGHSNPFYLRVIEIEIAPLIYLFNYLFSSKKLKNPFLACLFFISFSIFFFFPVPTCQLCIMVHLLVSQRVLNVHSSLQSFPGRSGEVLAMRDALLFSHRPPPAPSLLFNSNYSWLRLDKRSHSLKVIHKHWERCWLCL